MEPLQQFPIISKEGIVIRVQDDIESESEAEFLPQENNLDLKLPSLSVLKDPQQFFAFFGGVLHPRKRDGNGYPVRVTKLAKYQEEFAKIDRGVMLKCNKAGVTTSESIDDFRTRLIPEYAGFDCLLVGQNQFMADQHLLDLKKLVIQSPTLRPFMITRPERRFKMLPEEKSKMKMMYIENPYDPDRPSRIISLGFSESLAYSWKNVNRLHISDPGMIKRVQQQQFFSGLYSRLSNTEGQIKIEGVAGERRGYFWDLCRKLFKIEDSFEDEQDYLDPERLLELEIEDPGKISQSFKPLLITADDAVTAGVITKKWLDYMRTIVSKEEFLRLYYCKFTKPEGTIFGEFKTGEHVPLGLEDL